MATFNAPSSDDPCQTFAICTLLEFFGYSNDPFGMIHSAYDGQRISNRDATVKISKAR